MEEKICPELNDVCIKEKCAKWCELTQTLNGAQRRIGMCYALATPYMLAEISVKLTPQKLAVPELLRAK